MSIDIESLTIGEARLLASTLAGLTGASPSALSDDSWDHAALPVGSIVCVETILPQIVGRLTHVTRQTLTLREAAWVSSTGRASVFAAGGEPEEVEPYPDTTPLVIERSSVVSVRLHKATLRVVK